MNNTPKQKIGKIINSSQDLMNNVKKANKALNGILDTLDCSINLISTLIMDMCPDVSSCDRVYALLNSGLKFETMDDNGEIKIRVFNESTGEFSDFYDLVAWVRYETDFN